VVGSCSSPFWSQTGSRADSPVRTANTNGLGPPYRALCFAPSPSTSSTDALAAAPSRAPRFAKLSRSVRSDQEALLGSRAVSSRSCHKTGIRMGRCRGNGSRRREGTRHGTSNAGDSWARGAGRADVLGVCATRLDTRELAGTRLHGVLTPPCRARSHVTRLSGAGWSGSCSTSGACAETNRRASEPSLQRQSSAVLVPHGPEPNLEARGGANGVGRVSRKLVRADQGAANLLTLAKGNA
jgi:hypothetical protein